MLVLTPECVAAPEFATHLRPIAQQVQIVETTAFSLATVQRIAREFRAHRVVIPDGDGHLLEVARRTPAEGDASVALLCMRARSQPGRANQLKFRAKEIAKSTARMRPGVEVYDLASSMSGSPRHWEVPDPIEFAASPADVADFRRRHRMNDGRFWFAVVGAITARKNLTLIIAALKGLAAAEVGLLLAGRVDPALESSLAPELDALERQGVAVRRVPGPMDDVQFDAAVQAADGHVLAYDNEGPSGIFGKAVLAGRRIVAAGSETLKADCDASGGLALWCALAPGPLTQAMQTVMTARESGAAPTAAPASGDLFASRLLGETSDRRLLQVLLSERIGGAEAVAGTLRDEWTKEGVESDIVYVDDTPPGPLKQVTRVIDLAWKVRQFSPEALVSHSATPNLYTRMIVPRGVPVLTVLHSASDDYRSRRFRWAERVLRRRTSHVVAVSESQKESYQKRFGGAVPTTVIPNGIADGYAAPTGPIPAAPRTIVTIARVTRQKNPALWLSVAENLLARNPDLTFTWYGPIDGAPEIQAVVDRASRIPGVRFAGPTDQVAAVLAGADIVFHPADREAHSIAVLEAGASGVPLVCADGLDGAPGFAAAHFEPGDVAGAEHAVAAVIESFEQASRTARAQAPSIMADASGTSMARKYLDLLSTSGV
ncbi:glycosyltransferase family 4 protein [Kineosporia succinea]|uniref:Glycosyltransferase involved in cell wall biosynthesis n=1 Tax=Kineosporia succinea TaxID=84632 RepID=A0ABT9NXJ7_9ACTN|nr:glycosyltransferase family 4 protein [Kineosporia succinea]MDP9825002.1 glycosyltransferase involved in cell wall biosynthesis [Kineosporia succinea]